MQSRFVWYVVTILLMAAPVTLAEPTTAPTNPSENEVRDRAERNRGAADLQKRVERALGEGAPPATAPSAAPTSSPSAQTSKFPTPAELYAKLKKQREERAARIKIAYIDLNQPVTEKPSDFSLFGSDRQITLRGLLERLHKARDDKDVRALFITIGDPSIGLAQAMEIRDQLKEVARAGKRVFVYADSYDTAAYTLASGATDICILPGGELMIPGVSLETMFYKGTLDKIGVQADYIQIGEFKGAEEPYTRTSPSEELRGELTRLTESLYEQLIDGISASRNVSRDAVKRLIDDTILTAAAAKDRGFVDHIVDQDALRDLLKDELGGDIELQREYGMAKREEVDFSNPFALLASLTKKPEVTSKPAVAIIYADGTIVDGDGEAGLLGGGGVGSDPMRRAFRTALNDENVKAVVLRIDSPGGSALASEVMWQAARRLAAKKPLVVSVGGMAASGGYYLASAGDHIFADPAGIVGSIGVVGGKFVTKDLYEKLGLSTETFAKGRNAGLFNSSSPWSDRQRRMVRMWMQQTYDQFTQRVMTTRAGKISDIDKVARGRIFLAQQAKDLGMVDELGGMEAAITYAANKADLETGDYDVRVVPRPRTLGDLFSSGASDDEDVRLPFKPSLSLTLAPDSVFNAFSPEMRSLVSQQVRMLQLLQQRPVVLMSPFVLKVR